MASKNQPAFVLVTYSVTVLRINPKLLAQRVAGVPQELNSPGIFDSFADFAAWGESFHPAAAKANLDAKSVGLTTYRDSAFYRYVPELSIAPAIAKPANK